MLVLFVGFEHEASVGDWGRTDGTDSMGDEKEYPICGSVLPTPSSSVVNGEGVQVFLISDDCRLLLTCIASLNPFNVRLRLDDLCMNGGRVIEVLGPASNTFGKGVMGPIIDHSIDRVRDLAFDVASPLSYS